jgi:hypothetical protein
VVGSDVVLPIFERLGRFLRLHGGDRLRPPNMPR